MQKVIKAEWAYCWNMTFNDWKYTYLQTIKQTFWSTSWSISNNYKPNHAFDQHYTNPSQHAASVRLESQLRWPSSKSLIYQADADPQWREICFPVKSNDIVVRPIFTNQWEGPGFVTVSKSRGNIRARGNQLPPHPSSYYSHRPPLLPALSMTCTYGQ